MEDIDQPFPSRHKYSRFYVQSGYRGFLREARSDRLNKLDALLCRQGPHGFSDPACSDMVIGLTLAGATPVSWRVGSKWRETRARRPGHIGISPIGEVIDFDIAEPHSLLVVAVSRSALMDATADIDADCLDILNKGHHAYFRDHASALYMQHLWRALETQDRFSAIEIDGLLQGLIASLLRRLGDAHTRRNEGGEIPCERLEEFVRANVGEGVSVADLAGLSDMSVVTFNRHFKRRMGVTPYQYVQRLRVQMACEYLMTGGTELPEIAFRLGFADQSHMTNSFQRHVGVSPSRFLRDRTTS